MFRFKTHAREAEVEEGNKVEQSTPESPVFDQFDARHLYRPAGLLELDPDLWVFRRFGKLHLFNLLHLQQRLAKLQRTLEKQIADPKTQNFSELIPEIKRTLAEYDQALAAQATFRSYKTPTPDILDLLDYSALNCVDGNCALLKDGLGRGSVPPTDLASIAVADKTWTHRFIERHEFLRKRFTERKIEAAQIYSYSEAGIRFAEEVFINACFCLLLIGPVVVLSYLNSKAWKLVFISLCLFVASAFSGGFINVPSKTNLALIAGYAAVLVVFLSNSGSS